MVDGALHMLSTFASAMTRLSPIRQQHSVRTSSNSSRSLLLAQRSPGQVETPDSAANILQHQQSSSGTGDAAERDKALYDALLGFLQLRGAVGTITAHDNSRVAAVDRKSLGEYFAVHNEKLKPAVLDQRLQHLGCIVKDNYVVVDTFWNELDSENLFRDGSLHNAPSAPRFAGNLPNRSNSEATPKGGRSNSETEGVPEKKSQAKRRLEHTPHTSPETIHPNKRVRSDGAGGDCGQSTTPHEFVVLVSNAWREATGFRLFRVTQWDPMTDSPRTPLRVYEMLPLQERAHNKDECNRDQLHFKQTQRQLSWRFFTSAPHQHTWQCVELKEVEAGWYAVPEQKQRIIQLYASLRHDDSGGTERKESNAGSWTQE